MQPGWSWKLTLRNCELPSSVFLYGWTPCRTGEGGRKKLLARHGWICLKTSKKNPNRFQITSFFLSKTKFENPKISQKCHCWPLVQQKSHCFFWHLSSQSTRAKGRCKMLQLSVAGLPQNYSHQSFWTQITMGNKKGGWW